MQRLILPLLICFVLSLGFLLMPSMAYQATVRQEAFASAKTSITATTSLTNACGCQPRALDLYYIVDLSSSMGQLYPGADNKLDAAKEAIVAANQLITSWNNKSRVGLITYYGGQNGGCDGRNQCHQAKSSRIYLSCASDSRARNQYV